MNATVPRKGRPRRRDGDRTTKRSQIAVSISDCGWRGRWCSRKHRLPQYLTGLIDEYLQEYRPILLRSRSEDWLFPGNTPQTLHREQVARREKRAMTNSACRSAL